jgi:hypothetical protein
MGFPKVSTNSENELTWTGLRVGPFKERPMITGPTPRGASGNCELSISETKTPGDTNLNLSTDMVCCSPYLRYILFSEHASMLSVLSSFN